MVAVIVAPLSDMPICKYCDHGGRQHNWVVPPCSNCGERSPHCHLCFEKYHERRKRGQCRYPGCRCAKYVPLSETPPPVNRLLGRVFYRRPR